MVTGILESVRGELIREATASPAMLADLAGLERYVAQTYSARSFVEMLQNADDASADRVRFEVVGDLLFCANDGREFTQQDFHSLCRSAASGKTRGESIGYRGIGFKSVAGIGNEIHVISGQLSATFSRDLTRAALGTHLPTPLIRIPHPFSKAEQSEVNQRAQFLLQQGFTTVFVVEGLDKSAVATELADFGSDYLLFLRNVTEVVIDANRTAEYGCTRAQRGSGGRQVWTRSPRGEEEWLIKEGNKVAIAFAFADGKATPLKPADAVAHAFLPTLEQTGLGVRINADFSTDPSRTRIILDEATESCISASAGLIARLVREATAQHGALNNDVLACLTPTVGGVELQFQRQSFKIEMVSRVLAELSFVTREFALAPSWLNPADAAQLSQEGEGVTTLAQSQEESPIVPILRLLGVRPIPTEQVAAAAVVGRLSPGGCADLVAHVCQTASSSGPTVEDLVEHPIWTGAEGGPAASLSDVVQRQEAIQPEFVQMIRERGVAPSSLRRRLARHIGEQAAESLIPAAEPAEVPLDEGSGGSLETRVPDSANGEPTTSGIEILLRRSARPMTVHTIGVSAPWRSAELLVHQLLGTLGFEAEDHSRQNVGYDLLAVRDGTRYYVEVKSLSQSGQPFALTPNEESTAREHSDRYLIALVLRGPAGAYVQFIQSPLASLVFVKQCRQWAWECSEYKFAASHFVPVDSRV